MTSGVPGQAARWRAGYEALTRRIEALPELLRAFEIGERVLGVDPPGVRRFLVTGVGSSAAHARYLALILSQNLGWPAAFVSSGRLQASAGPGSERDVLIVFSQGLCPNARFALARPDRFAEVVLFTAVVPGNPGEGSSPAGIERQQFLAALVAQGVRVVPFFGQEEYDTLVRVAGPMLGYAAAFHFARSLAPEGSGLPDWEVETLVAGMGRAAARVEEDFSRKGSVAAALAAELTLVAGGGYGEMIQNLPSKVQEGMGLPLPPVFDVLEFAHGGFQRVALREATVLVLLPAGCGDEGVSRLRRILDPDRHLVRILDSAREPALAVFEHEAYFNQLLLRFIEETALDPREWPGKGRDGPLYDWSPVGEREETSGSASRPLGLSSPELEQRLRVEELTAVIALGSTEQHGAHLPLSTDSDIAQSLARRFCARVEEAVAFPVLAMGVAPEHMEFAGTLSLRESTLEAVLVDILSSVARHGFERVFVFFAHGGNAGALARSSRTLQDAAPDLQVIVFDAWDEVVAQCHAEAARCGVSSAAAGHHAGEVETSIMAAIRPGTIDRTALAPGLAVRSEDAASVFSAGMRSRVPGGVVGDPRGADALRGERYLALWVDRLVDAYRDAKNRSQITGMKNE